MQLRLPKWAWSTVQLDSRSRGGCLRYEARHKLAQREAMSNPKGAVVHAWSKLANFPETTARDEQSRKFLADDELKKPSTLSLSRGFSHRNCVEIHPEFPGRVTVSMREIVGGVVRIVTLSRNYPGVFVGDSRENLCSRKFPAIQCIRCFG